MAPFFIRPASAETDAEAIRQIYAPYVAQTAITFEYDVPSVEEMAVRIRHTQQRYPYLVASVDGDVIAYAYVSPFKERAAYDWSVETSIYVRGDQRRNGVGRALYDALECALRLQGVVQMHACIAVPDSDDAHLTHGSVRFHEHLGYHQTGCFPHCAYKFDTWYNMVWMSKQLIPCPQSPHPLRPFSEIADAWAREMHASAEK